MHLVFEKDSAVYAATRDANVKLRLLPAGVEVLNILGHTLYDPRAVVDAHGRKVTLSVSSWHAASYACRWTNGFVSHTPFLPQAVRNLPAPDRPLPPPKYIPLPGDISTSMSTRTEHSICRNGDLNAGGRGTEVVCHIIMIPSPITPLQTPRHLTI